MGLFINARRMRTRVTVVTYSGKLSREKTRRSVKIKISRRKVLWNLCMGVAID